MHDLGLRDASNESIFEQARVNDAVVLTKDGDFVRLLEKFGPPPKFVWLTCGNTSEAALQSLLARQLSSALRLLGEGEALAEIGHP